MRSTILIGQRRRVLSHQPGVDCLDRVRDRTIPAQIGHRVVRTSLLRLMERGGASSLFQHECTEVLGCRPDEGAVKKQRT